jgi:hypothetical protein
MVYLLTRNRLGEGSESVESSPTLRRAVAFILFVLHCSVICLFDLIIWICSYCLWYVWFSDFDSILFNYYFVFVIIVLPSTTSAITEILEKWPVQFFLLVRRRHPITCNTHHTNYLPIPWRQELMQTGFPSKYPILLEYNGVQQVSGSGELGLRPTPS